MEYKNPAALVSTQWLADHLSAPDLRTVDATWYIPSPNPADTPDARAEFDACHIPGAVYFDIDDIADSDDPSPHMLPSPEKFSSRVRKLGLGDGNRVVVYDNNGGIASARVWWMFRVFGHGDVAVLDGGLPKWLEEGRPTEDHPTVIQERHFTARFDSTLVREIDQMISLSARGAQIADTRSAGRFTGTVPEPRPGLESGHIPGSVNLHYADLLDPDTKTFLPADRLAAKVSGAGLALDKPIVATCGSGVSAALLALGLHLLGADEVAVYDGSWSEWGADPSTPKETG
ncbi:MAG: 3-mercaptopyruvate sulfurtransferase [Alphaproteobacteria bacterium]|nr:3-mercaptopyruvate sulfurtransferase [Alphaproteobacteria bacterium]